MFNVGLCGLPESASKVKEKIVSFLGGVTIQYSVTSFSNAEELIASGYAYHLCFVNRLLRENAENNLLTYISGSSKKNGKNKYRFITYTDDPISDKDCDTILECIRRYLDYDSMYLCVEFLTEQGLKTIAISRILFFEYCNRKIRIKTQNMEYYCDDTLHSILSLVSGYSFVSPHKSFIVNMRHIKSIKGYSIVMSDDSIVPLSQKKSRDFRIGYKVYLEDTNAKISKRKRTKQRES